MSYEETPLPFSVDFLKEVYLFGLDLTDDAGNPYSDVLYEHYIRAAVARLEREIEIPVNPISLVGETHDYWRRDARQWFWFETDWSPILEITKVELKYPGTGTNVSFPIEWVTFDKRGIGNRVQMVPRSGTLDQVFIAQGGSNFPMYQYAEGYVPDLINIDYRAGFDFQKIPADVKHAIAMIAAMGPLNIAGDLLGGAGIATKSISIPGISTNVSTTSSATNAGYGARILQYFKELKVIIPRLREYYGKNVKLAVM